MEYPTIKLPRLPYSYSGNKRLEYKYIHDLVTEYTNSSSENITFVDPFGGSFSSMIYILKYHSKIRNIHINDIKPIILDIWNIIIEGDESIQELEDYMNTFGAITENVFYDITRMEANTSKERILKFLILNKCSYLGNTNMFDTCKKPIKSISLKHYKVLHKLITESGVNIKLSNLDYKDILEMYTDKRALVYFDPPYISKSIKQYGRIFNIEDFEIIKNFIYTSNCASIVQVEYTAYTREEYTDIYVRCYKKSYSVNTAKNKSYGKYHLVLYKPL